MAIESKLSEAEIKTIPLANQKDIESRYYPWKIMAEKSQSYNEALTTLENRMSEIRELFESADQDAQGLLEEEWMVLVSYKDTSLRIKITQENEHIKKQHMEQLYNTLRVLGTFSFNNPKDAVLRKNMAKMFHQVEKYCIRNHIETQKSGSKECSTAKQLQQTSMAPPIPPPPPPPPPPQLSCKPLTRTPRTKTPQIQRNPMSTAGQHTPISSMNCELLRSIQCGRALDLKRTPCKRSPGGTPLKKQRRLSENDTSDLITMALKRKFKNVHCISSPNENLSPNIKSPSLEFP